MRRSINVRATFKIQSFEFLKHIFSEHVHTMATYLRSILLLGVCLLATGCNFEKNWLTGKAYVTVGGTVSGLTSGSVQLVNNGQDKITVTNNGSFKFSLSIASGTSYAVSVSNQPTGLSCTVANADGAASNDVTNVSVVCVPYAFTRRPLDSIYDTGKAINYSAYRTSGGPASFEVPTDTQILQDLDLLHKAGFNLLRLFGAAPPATDVVSEKILKLASQNYPDIKFQLGVFLGGLTTCSDTVNDKNVAYLITKLSKYSNVVAISVGNETSFYSKYMPVACLEGYIRTIRAQVSQPVTTDDDYTFYAGLTSAGGDRVAVKPDTILPLIDFASIHLYPFSNSGWDWKQTDVPGGTARAEKTMETSLDVAKDWFGRVSTYIQPFAAGMPIVVGETGWKSRQTNNSSELEAYLANPVNTKWYTDLLYGSAVSGYPAWEGSEGGPRTIFYFEAFDESWKGNDDGWGLWNSDRAARYALCGVATSVTCNSELYKDASFYTAGDVNVYTNSSVTSGFDSCPNWGQATICGEEVTQAGFKALKYSNLNYQGLTWESGPLDVSAKTTLHMDLWTPDISSIEISLISAGVENPVQKTLTANSWNSIDIPLTSYTANKSAVIQIKLVAAGYGTVYVRNIQFTGTSSGPLVVLSGSTVTPGFDSCPNWGQSTVCGGEIAVAGFKALQYSNLNYQGLDWYNNPIDVSAKTTLHIDFWTPSLTSIQVSLVSAGPVQNAYTQTLNPGVWTSADIPLSNYVADKSAIRQLVLAAVGSGTVYVRNIYFNGTSAPNAPTTAPSTSIPVGAVNVYSDAAVTAGFDSCPNWGQATQCSPEQTIAANKLIKYSNLNYQGLTWETSPLNVSAKTTLHMDLWTPDISSIEIFLISAGVENSVQKTLTANSWNSIDIPLSSYNANKSAVIQIKLVAAGSGTVYVDNIYFQ